MNQMPNSIDLFDRRETYPDFIFQERLSNLVGLDDQIDRLTKVLSLLLNPTGLQAWMNTHHKGADNLLKSILRRPPLVVLAGDVGSGKTELAETIGDAVARQEGIGLTLFPLSLASRGQGRVGEMTQLISSAFDTVIHEAKRLKGSSDQARGGIVFLIDEADAIAQSRENEQMHHEDRAGVNAFIRGIDRIANAGLPVAILMCTNRLGSLDPAVKRRAADILAFGRPSDQQRGAVLSAPLKQLGFSNSQIEPIVVATGKQANREYGCTFSDLTQRVIPRIVLDAYPSGPVNPKRALQIAKSIVPTPPFREKGQ